MILFVILGFFVSNLIIQSLRNEDHSVSGQQQQPIPPLFIAKIIDHLQAKDKVQALQLLEGWQQDGRGPVLTLLDSQGRILYTGASTPTSRVLDSIDLNLFASLKRDYDYVYIPVIKKDKLNEITHLDSKNNQEVHPNFFERFIRFDFFLRLVPPPPPPDFHGPPPPFEQQKGSQPPFGSENDLLVKLSGQPVQYLLIQHRGFELTPLKEFDKPFRRKPLLPFLGIGSLFLSLFIGIGVTLFIISISVYKKLKEADLVISELHSGNLKARFKIERQDEFGEAMIRFNKMADEIQNLVEHLQFVEAARTKLLQELAHDLRTPIASLKGLLETLETKDHRLKPEVRREILELSSREIEYFERLVEDLLLLSQASEPKYNLEDHKQISIQDVVADEIEDFKILHQQGVKKITYQDSSSDLNIKIYGDELLFKRMIVNILTNAYTFAQNEIKIHINQINNQDLELSFEDDGAGFTEEQLQSYGNRKMSRQYMISKNSEKRLSIGLGSVIVKKIAQLHRGEIFVENRVNKFGQVCGACVKIRFKI